MQSPGHGYREQDASRGTYPVNTGCGCHGDYLAENDLRQLGLKSMAKDGLLEVANSCQQEHKQQ